MTIERTVQGDQIVLDGFERSHKQALAARAVRRLKPAKPQAASPGPLFEERPEQQLDLFQPKEHSEHPPRDFQGRHRGPFLWPRSGRRPYRNRL